MRPLWLAASAFGAGLATALVAARLFRRKTSSAFKGINSSVSGARTQSNLPKGKHEIQLYSLGTPNGKKVTVLLEELGVDYDAWMINIMKGDQFGSGFVALNPNSKIPTMLDTNGPNGKEFPVFESGSILLYLAEKYDNEGKFLPKDPALRSEVITWLFFNIGSAPYFGQFGHFYKYCSEKIEYAIDRYSTETKRILDVLDKRLQDRTFLVAEQFTIADIAWYPWVNALGAENGYNASKTLDLASYKNVQAWMERIAARPKVVVGMRINTDVQKERH
jgi:GSH-dependent disulfide-bond oxidoreductase